MTRSRMLAAVLAVVAAGGGVASAQEGDPTQTVTIQVEAARTITLENEAVTGAALRPTDSDEYAAGTVSYTTDNPGEDYVVASATAGLANPSEDVELALAPSGFTCDCGSPGVRVDGDPIASNYQPVTLGDVATAIVTGIYDTGGDVATATLTYTVTTTAALPGEYQFTVTFVITGA